MLIIVSDLKKDNDEAVLALAVSILKAGGVIAYATDTCYGFSCDATNLQAVDRLRKIKKMSEEKPISLMFSSLEQIEKMVVFNDLAFSLAQDYWPGNLTLICKKKEGSSVEFANIQHSSLGCRIPNCSFSQKMISLLGSPITTTSANLSKLPPAYSAFEIFEQFFGMEDKPDLVIDSGLIPFVLPTTIIDLTKGKMDILRKGSVVPLESKYGAK